MPDRIHRIARLVPRRLHLLWLSMLLAVAGGLTFMQPAAGQATTVIVVDTSADLDPNSITKTCTYSQGGTFIPANDGCTLRRAIIEASGRPQEDRPIEIRFNLANDDPNRNLEVTGTWTLPLARPLVLKTPTILDKNGEVTIDGSTQPGGRSNAPKIIVDMDENSLEIQSTGNVIRNLSLKNGGAIIIHENDNTIEQIWMGLNDAGTAIAFREPGNERRMAHGGIRIEAANNNIIRNSVLSGAFAPAVFMSGGNNNVVENNRIGTRADGTVPVVPQASYCVRSLTYDPQSWYGGWGINISGSNHTIIGNRIAGLHIVQSPNDSAPLAIEIFGGGHTIQDNIIGVAANDAEVGTCGYAIKASGNNLDILDNVIVRSGVSYEEGEESAIFASGTQPSFGQVTLRGNLVKDGPGDYYGFGPGVATALRTFNPAKITGINGVNVSGTAGNGSPCPNCIIDFYLDDLDGVQEAFEHLGSATANAQGNFTFVLPNPVPANRALRTTSTTASNNVIGTFGAGTTTKMSALQLPLSAVIIQAPSTGSVNVSYPVTVTIDPTNATPPFDYTVAATGQTSFQVNDSNAVSLTTSFEWTTPGVKTITVTVANALGAVSDTHQITIDAPDTDIPLASVALAMQATGTVGVAVPVTATITPSNATPPFDYTVEATDMAPRGLTGSDFTGITTSYIWNTPGVKTVKVTVESALGPVSAERQITISGGTGGDGSIYLPSIQR